MQGPQSCLTLLRAVPVTAIGAALPLWTQIGSGRVVDSVSGLPVGTGFVVLLDPAVTEIARALRTSDGRFVSRAPNAGVYRLRSERLRYRAHESHCCSSLPTPLSVTYLESWPFEPYSVR